MYLSCSYSAKTFRLVWSRMILALMNPPKSSFFDRKADMMDRYLDVFDVTDQFELHYISWAN